MTPASTRTRDRWTEARTGPGPLYPRNGRRPHAVQGTCDDTASWPPQRPADGQQRAALRERVTGHQEGSRGLINPSRRMFSTAPVRGYPPGAYAFRSPVPSMSLRAKDHLEGTKVAVSPRYCAEQKVQTGSAAAGGHRGVATRKTTGDLATRRGAGDPEIRAEWMKVSRYGHLRSAPVVVDAGYARSGNRLHFLQRLRPGLSR